MTISPAVSAALRVINAAWANGTSYDLASQAAFALESAQMLQSPENAAELERLRARVAELESTSARRLIAWRRARTRARATAGAADRYAGRAAELQTALQDTLAALLTGQAEREGLRARVAELEQQIPTEASPWQRAVDGLNSLVDAEIPVHVEPDGHISNPCGDEHIEWDRTAERWRLVHDDEMPPVCRHMSPYGRSCGLDKGHDGDHEMSDGAGGHFGWPAEELTHAEPCRWPASPGCSCGILAPARKAGA